MADLGELSVNSSIGAYAKDLTNMENTGRMGTAKSRLIKGYSILAEPAVKPTRCQSPPRSGRERIV